MPSKTMNQKNLVRIFKDVKRLNNDDIRFCFLLGAGASVSSGIPTGWALAERWYNDIKEDFEEKDRSKWEKKIGFDEERLGEFYPRIYEKRFESSPEMGYAEFKKLMEDKEPSIGYVILAQILANEKHNFVITTNFDYLVEDAVRTYTDTKPFSAGHETLAGFISSQTERPTIIKVHRDLFLDPFNDADNTEILKKEWKEALKPILRNFNLLVLGYGGNDGSLMDYLKEIKPEERKSIYWCKREQDTINKKVKSLLTNKDYLVTINDFDDVMYALYTSLDYDILKNIEKPEKHKFIISSKEKIKRLNRKKQEIIENRIKENKNITEAVKELFAGSASEYNWKIKDAKDNDLKEQLFKEAVEKYPESSSLLNNYALFLEEVKKEYDLAEEYYLKALKVNPNYDTALGNYAFFLKSVKKEYDLAEKYYLKALKANPDQSNNLGNYASFLKEIRKEYNLAEEYYLKALKANPDQSNNLGNYASFLSNIKHDYNNAEKYFQKTIELDSKNANYLGNYAHHLILSKQDFKKAEKYINQAFDLNPEFEILLELWFYRYAHYPKYFEEAAEQLEKILKEGGKSIGWNLQPHVEIAEANGHKDVARLKEFARRITEE